MEVLEILLIVVILELAGILIAVWRDVKQTSAVHVKQTSAVPLNDIPAVYDAWFRSMQIVFSGGSKEVQEAFLTSEQNAIEGWLTSPDFKKKYSKIIDEFGK